MNEQDEFLEEEQPKNSQVFKQRTIYMVIIVLLIIFSSLLFHFINENHYLQNYNNALECYISVNQFIKTFNKTKITNQQELLSTIDEYIHQLDSSIDSFSQLESPDNYKEQHSNLIKYLQESKQVLLQIRQTIKASTDILNIFK